MLLVLQVSIGYGIQNIVVQKNVLKYVLLPSRKIGVQAIWAETAAHAAVSSIATACRMVRADSHRARAAQPRRFLICHHAPFSLDSRTTNKTSNERPCPNLHDCTITEK